MDTVEQQRSERDARWRAWMAAAQTGDREAHERLLTELLPFVRRIVRERVWQPAGEDIVQEVLLSIHAARHTWRSERALTPWVRAIARNAVIDWARRELRQRRREADVEAAELADDAPVLDERAEVGLPLALRSALETLPAAQRQAVLLLKVEGLSVAEAAQRAGVSPGALKLRAHRGYRALRARLAQERR